MWWRVERSPVSLCGSRHSLGVCVYLYDTRTPELFRFYFNPKEAYRVFYLRFFVPSGRDCDVTWKLKVSTRAKIKVAENVWIFPFCFIPSFHPSNHHRAPNHNEEVTSTLMIKRLSYLNVLWNFYLKWINMYSLVFFEEKFWDVSEQLWKIN